MKKQQTRQQPSTEKHSLQNNLFFILWDLVLVFTHAVVAAPARAGFGCVTHLLEGFRSEVAQLPQATVVEHPGADPAGVKVVGRPHLAHITHLVAWRLRQKRS